MPATPTIAAEPDLLFRKDLYFYQMVSASSISFSAYPYIFNENNPGNLKPGDYIALPSKIVTDRHFMPHDLRREAALGHINVNDYLGSVCMMLANTAYESVKNRNDHSPEFEFFRHVRNACSHLNHFNFTDREPSRPASWRGFVIDHILKGRANPLFGRGCFGYILGAGDIFPLLWDIEQILIRQDEAKAAKP
jgi:hypothetical protein